MVPVNQSKAQAFKRGRCIELEEHLTETTVKSRKVFNGGVIRIPRNPVTIQQSQPAPLCPLTQMRRLRQGKLQREMSSKGRELEKLEQENSLLEARIQEWDVIVTKQDYNVACLKYELEKVQKEKSDLEAQLSAQEAPRISPAYQVTHSLSTPIVIQRVEKSAVPHPVVSTRKTNSAKPNPFHLQHLADEDKEPEVFCKCGVQFVSKQNLREHIRYYTAGQKFLCSACGIRKHGMNQLRTHIKETHGISSAYLDSLKGCRLCGHLFTSMAELHVHRRTEHGRQRVK